jgi:hypothetical protein
VADVRSGSQMSVLGRQMSDLLDYLDFDFFPGFSVAWFSKRSTLKCLGTRGRNTNTRNTSFVYFGVSLKHINIMVMK